ncbi:hypothetical protein Vadar_022076 [Vaccinium darrowii]|uniref:Uncharacterized protein n=1 Tax=Vaccinium darrowii TaxID=229202 RepID=A0ACB7Z5Z1_9ERIC|nr:hypothetical protein Vadar_022076 [Vaccinium darrowii]
MAISVIGLLTLLQEIDSDAATLNPATWPTHSINIMSESSTSSAAHGSGTSSPSSQPEIGNNPSENPSENDGDELAENENVLDKDDIAKLRKHKKKEESTRQQVLTNNFNKGHTPQGPPLSSYSYDQDTARKELASAIIMHEYPLSIMEHVGFKYSFALQPAFKVPCRNTIKSDIFFCTRRGRQ